MLPLPSWRFLEVGAFSGARNMALDEAILAEVEAGRSPPTVRVYGWNPSCLSLGHSQDPATELDLPRVREMGHGLVLRATGGRAVLHAGELTYSVIAPANAAPWCASQSLSYAFISRAVAAALADGGFGTALDRGYPVEKPAAARAMTPCFSSTARSEVVWNGRKVVGSAQRRLRDCFLQHGSVLVSEAHRDIVSCLKLEEGRRGEYLRILDANAVSLQAIAGHAVDWFSLAEGFLPRLAQGLGMPLHFGRLTGREEDLARDLETAKLRLQEDIFDGRTGSPAGQMSRGLERQINGHETTGDKIGAAIRAGGVLTPAGFENGRKAGKADALVPAAGLRGAAHA